jgi:hypothetical protein
MGNGGSFFGGVLKVIGTLFVIALVVIAGLVAVVIYHVHRESKPPDVAALGRSATVAEADATATQLIDDRLSTLTALAVDMTPVATSVADVCSAERDGSFGVGYRSARCSRTVARYFGFGGAVAARWEGWNQALLGAGWTSHEPSPQPSAWRWPMTYDDPALVGLEVDWAERPQTPPLLTDRVSSLDATYYRTDQRVDAATASAMVYRDSPYLAVAVLEMKYYDANTTPTPSPTPGSNYHPCFSGSGTCVGG